MGFTVEDKVTVMMPALDVSDDTTTVGVDVEKILLVGALLLNCCVMAGVGLRLPTCLRTLCRLVFG